MAYDQIEHVFVLMLENRSFDHLLGFSGITGTDPVTGLPTSIDGLRGTEQNSYGGSGYPVRNPADYALTVDPGHEFPDVLCQLAGAAAVYPSGGKYPPIDNSGYVASYVDACKKAQQPNAPDEIMKCYSPDQLPVLTALAKEFALCDNWHASMPGPTWPNRMFVHAASSAGLDHSPTTAEILLWEMAAGFSFPNGDIFDRIGAKTGVERRLYAGDLFPMMAALKGIRLDDIRRYENFSADLQSPFPYNYVFIEPSYNLLNDYKGSTSQHPLDDIRLGEGLIKATYEAIRNSPLWENSLLILFWDEHGGFYDHAPPRPPWLRATHNRPQDTTSSDSHSSSTDRAFPPLSSLLGFRASNRIDHRLYDHASVPATVEALFGLTPMTKRDAAANHLLPLLSLTAARDDTPSALPSPASAAPMPRWPRPLSKLIQRTSRPVAQMTRLMTEACP